MNHRKHSSKFLIGFVLVLMIVFGIATLSNGPSVIGRISGLFGPPRIEFSSGSFSEETEDLSLVLKDGETALLSGFKNLKTCDFSGSKNYDEISKWAAENPGVSVKFTVDFPNGVSAPNDAQSLDLSGLKHEDVNSAVSLMKYLKGLSSLSLGNITKSGSALTADDISLLSGAAEGADIGYSFDLAGKEYSANDTEADLAGITSAQIPQTIEALKLLPELKNIKIAQGATLSGELALDDLAALGAAFPGASIDYSFTLCGQNVSLADEKLDLTAITPSDIDTVCKALSGMTKLRSISLGSSESGLSTENISAIGKAAPNAVLDYAMTLYGKEINLSDDGLDINHIKVEDNGAAVRAILPLMRSCTYLDMDSCGVGNADMAAIRDENPNVEVIWRVSFGSGYSVRTNVVKILASKPSKGGTLGNEIGEQLKYCTNVHYLDLGHNEQVSDFSFVANMPELEVAVISMAAISDLTPFSNCPHLKYLEAGNTRISDLSPLAKCTELKHLNVGTCEGVRDISPLYDLDMLRLWLGIGDPVPAEQVAKMRELHPDCEVNTTVPTGKELDENGGAANEGYTTEGWKYWQQLLTVDWNYYAANNNTFPAQRPLGYWKAVFKAFEYNLQERAYAFSWNDPKYEPHDASVKPVNTTLVNLSVLMEKWVPLTDKDPNFIVPDVLTDPPGEVVSVGEH